MFFLIASLGKTKYKELVVHKNLVHHVSKIGVVMKFKPISTFFILLLSLTSVFLSISCKNPILIISPPSPSLEEGVYDKEQIVTLTSDTDGASIYYTLDGQEPNSLSTKYTEAITISNNTTLKAITIHPSLGNSHILRVVYQIRAVAPVASLSNGTYEHTQHVTLSTTMSGAAIYYTLDGSEPSSDSTIFWLPIEIAKTTILKAITVHHSFASSKVNISEYEITGYNIRGFGEAGGYIFYDDDVGFDINNDGEILGGEKNLLEGDLRYLEAASSDLLIGNINFHKFGYHRPGGGDTVRIGTQMGIGTGQANTTACVEAMGDQAYVSSFSGTETTPNYATKSCDSYSVGGYDDWFLPSIDELNLMYRNLQEKIGGFSSSFYYSSSEDLTLFDSVGAYDFTNGMKVWAEKQSDLFVRPVRAF